MEIIAVGECLLDVYPGGAERVGGAPLNLAANFAQIGGTARMFSRIGKDPRGAAAEAACASLGIGGDLQRDATLPTGVSQVILHGSEAHYRLLRPAAWDALEYTGEWRALAQSCDAICFGTLAQRAEPSRVAIQTLLRETPARIRLLDVNLRSEMEWIAVIEESLRLATHVKLSEAELHDICRALNVAPDVVTLRETFHLEAILVTRGARGALLADRDGCQLVPPVSFPGEVHPVGAGDAAAAAFLFKLLQGGKTSSAAQAAVRMGAWVASQPAAIPEISAALRRELMEC